MEAQEQNLLMVFSTTVLDNLLVKLKKICDQNGISALSVIQPRPNGNRIVTPNGEVFVTLPGTVIQLTAPEEGLQVIVEQVGKWNLPPAAEDDREQITRLFTTSSEK